VHAWLAEA